MIDGGGYRHRSDAASVVRLRVGPIAEMILLACAAVTEFVAPANARPGITRMETERVG